MKSLALLKWLDAATVQQKRDLAKLAGTSPAYLRQIAHGWRRPSMELAAQIAQASQAWQSVLPVLTREQLHKGWTRWKS